MTREEAKELLPIIQAFIEGKEIEILDDARGWVKTENVIFNLSPNFYRIKPESKYRPFKNQEECWNEMLKHQPFGWIRSIGTKKLRNINSIDHTADGIGINNSIMYFGAAFNAYAFADGTPFGIKGE